jgi:hypothetical protein
VARRNPRESAWVSKEEHVFIGENGLGVEMVTKISDAATRRGWGCEDVTILGAQNLSHARARNGRNCGKCERADFQ